MFRANLRRLCRLVRKLPVLIPDPCLDSPCWPTLPIRGKHLGVRQLLLSTEVRAPEADRQSPVCESLSLLADRSIAGWLDVLQRIMHANSVRHPQEMNRSLA